MDCQSFESDGIVLILETLLAADRSSNTQAILVYLYLRDMQDYAVVNTAYVKAFASDLPARLVSLCWLYVPVGYIVRVCVQVDLSHPLTLRMDILFLNTNNRGISISHLHVQSISHWAPANIGPYSQACKVNRFFTMYFLFNSFL